MTRMEACDLEGRPVFTFTLGASSSLRATDEALSFFYLDLESTAGLTGGFTAVLVAGPGYCIVHLFDNGFRYESIFVNPYS